MTDLRDLITEMADELDHNRQCLLDDRRVTHPLADRARAALARWGNRQEILDNSTPQPIPVSERLPGAEDCDAEGRCWPGGSNPTLRYRIWGYCIQQLPEGCIYPKWVVALRLILFPRSTVSALILRTHPFNPLEMTWTIHGARFSDRLMATLAGQAKGDWFRIIQRSDGVVTIEKSLSSRD